MRILGITGGIGAGKSTVTAAFAGLGAAVIDADAIARRVMEPEGSAFGPVVRAFGKEILRPEGTIDRRALGDLVFSRQDRLELLNRITHACIFQEMKRELTEIRAKLVCLDVPLLFQEDFPIRCHKTLAVLAPRETRIRRVMARDGLTRDQVEARMSRQLSEQTLRELADYVICNDGGKEILLRQVKQIYMEMTEQ